jgi:aminopeptidase N
MKEGQPLATKLEDYRPAGYATEETALSFDIRDGATQVTSQLKIVRRDPSADSIRLDGQELELLSVAIDGRTLSGNEYQLDDESLTLFGLEQAHTLTLVTKIKPEENTALEGLYRSSAMYCTQCEAEGFRKITYYQDRPDVLAKFTTTIIADGERFPNLLSNGNLIHEEVRPDGRKAVTWQDPFPKPSYLFALVAGNLAVLEDKFVTMSGREVALKIFSEPHNIDQCDYAMDVLKRSMAWDEKRFGREYDLDVFMIVAVEDFNMGAMENKGLNIFNTSCVLATPDTATDDNFQRVEGVVAHEYFHNWSGNRVTCRDWFQLSLKEGFTVFRDAEFSGDMNSRAVKRIEDVLFLRSIQFAEDAGPLAHPVRPQAYIEISNFYTTTIYEKGAEVVRMYQTLLGPERFRAATDVYFARHDGTAATTDDFAATMAEVGEIDLAQFKRWYDQAGTPRLDVRESFSAGEMELTITQSCPPTPGQSEKEPFHIPVEIGLLGADMSASGTENGAALSWFDFAVDTNVKAETRDGGQSLLLEVREEETKIKFGYFDEKPVVSFLRNFSAPVKVNYARPDTELAYLAEHDSDGFVRWDALQTLWVKWFDEEQTLQDVDLLRVLGGVARQALEQNDSEAKLLSATMLSVPNENYLFGEVGRFEVDTLIDAREELLDAASIAHRELWGEMYGTFRSREPYSPSADAIADRALSNTAFGYLTRSLKGAELISLIEEHYASADNLTDRRAALVVMSRHPALDEAFRRKMLQDFYDRAQHQALVLDMWFSLQAQSPLSSIEELTKLEGHEKFDLKNPNRLRSLYAAFGMFNHRRFNSLDGSGYRFLGDAIARLDKLNPQIAARLATPLTRWQRLDARRQGLMCDVLRGLTANELSKDLYEIVTKSLEDAS